MMSDQVLPEPGIAGNPLPRYLSGLNEAQLAAVRHEGSPLLILAGAGSGKTRVITTKIAWLVRERGVEPESILAVTFTNKAAREMRERACAIEPSCSRAILRTFHSFGAWFLRRQAEVAGLDPNFIIYDDDDQASLLHAALPRYTKRECSAFCQTISRAKDYNLAPDSPELDMVSHEPEFRRIYQTYQDRLAATGNVDFGDLISLPARILAGNEAIARRTRQRFRVILVDEYQDSNVAQFELLRSLTGSDTYVCVVGDDDQSIYRFRGAEIKNILDFPVRFPGTRIVKLERNYRSYQSILDIAGDVVSKNSGRLGKTLVADRQGGNKASLALLEDQEEEVGYCVKHVQQHLSKGGPLQDIAILYRTNAQSLGFEKEFARLHIPYQLVGALRFYEREEVKDVLAWLAFTANPRDEVAFSRIANKPPRGLGEVALGSVVNQAAATGKDLLTAAKEAREILKGKAKAGITEVIHLATVFRSLAGIHAVKTTHSGTSAPDATASGTGFASDASTVVGTAIPAPGATVVATAIPVPAATEGATVVAPRTAPEVAPSAAADSPPEDGQSLAILMEAIATRSGLADYHKNQDEVAGTQKLANLDELVNAASLYPLNPDGLNTYLESIELDRSLLEKDQGKDAVTLITMHNTKGLEFPIVFVTGLEQGLFPRDEESGDELEEQRRLFYVAITRAKNELHLTMSRWRRIHGRLFESSPSRFLAEINPSRFTIRVDSAGFRSRFGQSQIRHAAHASFGEPGQEDHAGSGSGAGRGGYPYYGSRSAGSGTTTRFPELRGRTTNPGIPGRMPQDSLDEGWKQGVAVYHDEYGSGVIIKVSPTLSTGPLVVVRFETGKLAQFFPKLTKKLQIERN